jgi:Flp pilus assembly protein TadG
MKRIFLNLYRSKDGAVAPLVALTLTALIAAGGIAFDYARMASLDTELQSAADQAALAAASQLDGESGACARAVAAAQNLVSNKTYFANDLGGVAVTIADSGVCTNDTDITDDPAASVRFFQDKAGTTPADNVANAHFVEVRVNSRRANYALTAIVGAMTSGDISAKARAGLGTALCKVPPLMICNPTPGTPIDWNSMRGRGLRAVSNQGANWAPGAFGYIGPQDANSTEKALAYQNPIFDCQGINTEEPVSTGAPTPAITAINTRFDIYDIPGGGGNVLSPCLNSPGSACPPALNVVKDLVRPAGGACKMGNDWQLPTNRFSPRAYSASDTAMTPIDADGNIDAMGLPRDDCHYTSYNSPCPGGRIGDGKWARGDYFNKYHAGNIPPSASTMTRYETYRWEIDQAAIPAQVAGGSKTQGKNVIPLYQWGAPSCNATIPDPTRDRRVIQVAIGDNCAALHGASTPVQIGAWIDAFLVEPGTSGTNARGNGDSGNEIYLEIIGQVNPGGAAAQIVRRDTPYLVH